jgi:hypothetical protein
MPTIYAQHIEAARQEFFVRVRRAPCFNVLFKPARWETWRVLGETAEGALRIAKYHFYRSDQIELAEAEAATAAELE